MDAKHLEWMHVAINQRFAAVHGREPADEEIFYVEHVVFQRGDVLTGDGSWEDPIRPTWCDQQKE